MNIYNKIKIFFIFLIPKLTEEGSVINRKQSSDLSIMELINMDYVKKVMANKQNLSKSSDNGLQKYYYQNVNNSPPTNNLFSNKSISEYDELTGNKLRYDLKKFEGKKILKSSKQAMTVTTKNYLQKDWCKTEPLIQKVREPGCLSKTVINKFCYGQCNSFYIPVNLSKDKKGHRNEKMNSAFTSCSFCKPKKISLITVVLRCPQNKPPFKKKKIEKVKICRCMATNIN